MKGKSNNASNESNSFFVDFVLDFALISSFIGSSRPITVRSVNVSDEANGANGRCTGPTESSVSTDAIGVSTPLVSGDLIETSMERNFEINIFAKNATNELFSVVLVTTAVVIVVVTVVVAVVSF